jgi:hypothetical protein
MKDLFNQNPTQDAVVMADKMFGYHDGMLDIGEEEVRQVVSHANNLLLVEASSSSANRVGDALEEIMLKAKRIAAGYDLFSATRNIVRISYSPQNPLMMGEMEGLVEFAENFHPECCWYSSSIPLIINIWLKRRLSFFCLIFFAD